MTPEEKAKDLFDRFGNAYRKYNTKELLFSERLAAKQYALMAVDEILNNAIENEPGLTINWKDILCDKYYWNDVKEAIEKL